jgi:large subunit ribosomal protein L1
MMAKRHGKRYQANTAKASDEPLPTLEGVQRLKEMEGGKFDQTVECVAVLGVDTKQSDQVVRGSVSLPKGIGKTKRVVVFCQGDHAEKALAAGAVAAGEDDLVKRIQDGWMDFDVAIAMPNVMSKVSRLGRLLGPQGKMPSPKTGTVTEDFESAVREYSAGKVEFRADAGGNVHAPVGKMSFAAEDLAENIEALVSHLRRMRPSAAKGTYIRKVCISGTMTPSVRLDIGA